MKKLSSSLIAMEMKKEKLKEHLDEVEKLIKLWEGDLTAPNPFDHQGRDQWGWKSVYMPPSEQEGDNNHMLRKHLRSRMLWRHHSDWQLELNQIFKILLGVQQEARGKMDEMKKEGNWKFTNDALGVALLEAFRLLYDGKISNLYYPHNPGAYGIFWGGFHIEETAASEQEGEIVTEGHRDLVNSLAKLEKMKDIAKTRWPKVRLLEERMKGLVKTSLKSYDILYPCRFCRHLWIS